MKALPIAQYPDLVPPTVNVSVSYPGASAETISSTVLAPLEVNINGVENMLYMTSIAASGSGSGNINVYFKLGSDANMALVNVNNKVNLAQATLPEDVRRQGVTVVKRSPAMLQVLQEKGFANITTLQRDIFDGLPERYDAIVSCMAMHHVPDTRTLMQAFADALQPGGRIALVDLYAEDGSFHGDNAAKGVHHLGFAPDALQALAEQAGLQGIAFTEVLRVHRPNGREYPLFLMTGHKP